jgi:Calx-beta domain/FG-GAP-like repeat
MKRHTRLSIEALEDRRTPSFNPAVNYAAGTDPTDVLTADFNNDSVLDVAVANSGGGSVSVLLGNANGTFQGAITSPTGSPTGNQPSSLAVGDFNGDGKPDLVTADDHWASTDVTVLLGNGNGTFGAPTSYEAIFLGYSNGVGSVAVGDFNADSNLDIAAVSFYYEDGGSDGTYIGVLPGTGTGTFGTPQWSALARGIEWFSDSVVADFNANGKLDLAAPSDNGKVWTALGHGDGMFTQWGISYTGSNGTSIVAADFNADGKVDLAAAGHSAGNSSVSVMLNIGNGEFGTAQNYYTGSGSNSDLAVADFNGDGKLDLIASNSSNGTVSVLLGTGAGAFNLAAYAAVGTGPAGLAAGDFNGDDRPDVVATNAGSNTVSVLLNDGDWDGPPPPPPPPPTPSLSIDNAAVSEWNTGTVSATFTVRLSAVINQPVTVSYSTADSSAMAGSDYQAASGTLTFAPGETSKTVTVLVNGDRLVEPNETFFVNLSSPTNATIADGQGVGTIVDDEPRVSISDVTKSEGRRPYTTQFIFTVTLSAAYDQPVTMSFQTVNGTATTSNNDYVAKSGTLTFAPGETWKTITIAVKGDSKMEADETFTVNLSGAMNALLLDASGLGTILNDD